MKDRAIYSFFNETRKVELASRAVIAVSFFSRLQGLLGTNGLQEGMGLFLKPCNSIHMIGMTYAIDCVFVDKSMCVVGVVEKIGPFRISSIYPKAEGCLELPAGTVFKTQTTVGDTLTAKPVA